MNELLYDTLNYQTKITDTKTLKVLWQEKQYVNGNLSDEELQNLDDVEEIQGLLDSTADVEL